MTTNRIRLMAVDSHEVVHTGLKAILDPEDAIDGCGRGRIGPGSLPYGRHFRFERCVDGCSYGGHEWHRSLPNHQECQASSRT